MRSDSGSGFPSSVRISGLNTTGKGGPAFVGQVFSMCDLSGTGLMAVSTHFDIPFLSKRTPEWLKKMFAAVTKSERNGPVFRFFMDLGDAVSYVKKLNIPSGVVGACRLDLAYEHFKEKPHLFQFVPNEKQVKEANKLLKAMQQSDGRKKVDGVPVFSAQNLDIAIATTDGRNNPPSVWASRQRGIKLKEQDEAANYIEEDNLGVDLKGCDKKAKELFMTIDSNNQMNKGEQAIVKKKGVNELKGLELDAKFWSYGSRRGGGYLAIKDQ
ncbi:hypothetical protein H5410_016938 [Solanum commersonii]|uniref:Uncharacterized protein n=1 Tax=Solanum commersonii TaxID=4109 RepID=A0A9J5ZYN4_SOLCO|nr:hypothetical protein H5410_016938 [Solanum commersonii]